MRSYLSNDMNKYSTLHELDKQYMRHIVSHYSSKQQRIYSEFHGTEFKVDYSSWNLDDLLEENESTRAIVLGYRKNGKQLSHKKMIQAMIKNENPYKDVEHNQILLYPTPFRQKTLETLYKGIIKPAQVGWFSFSMIYKC